MPVRRPKPAVKNTKKPASARKAPRRAAAAKTVRPRVSRKAPAIEPLDLSALPPESVSQLEKWICLACVLDVFTRHLGLAPKTAHLEVKRYTPSLAELTGAAIARPYFAAREAKSP